MALDTRGLASGFAQGFGLMNNYQNQQKQNERAERGLQMREESFQMQKDQYDQAQKKETATMIYGKIINDIPLANEERTFLEENPIYQVPLNPAIDQTIGIAERVVDPEDPLDFNSEEALYSINAGFEPLINRGSGGKKRIAAGLPGAKPGTMSFDLDVEREDGTRDRQPLTANRGTVDDGDDEVRQVPVENLINTVQGIRMIRNGFAGAPGGKERAAKMYAILTGKEPEKGPEQWTEPFAYQGGYYQRNTTTGELREVQSPGDARKGQGTPELTPQQEVYAKRLQSEVDHLWRMERQIQTGQSDGLSIFLGGTEETVTPDNKDALLSDIRMRIQANEQELNKLLGASMPQQGFDALIQEAQNIPPEQRASELQDLKNNPRVPYTVVRQIEEMWNIGGGGQPAPAGDPAPSPQQQPQPQPAGLQQPQQQTQPQGLALPQEEAAPAGPQPSSAPAGLQMPGNDGPLLERQLGPIIESGARSVGQALDRRADKNINQSVRELSQIARGEREPHQGNIRQFLTNNPEAVKRLSPADIERLQQRYGERLINQFL